MAKLQNIKAIRQMIDGSHRTQTRKTFGYERKKDSSTRKVGDIWEETLPNGHVIEWEQKQGYRVRRAKNMKVLLDLQEELKKYPNCYPDCSKKKYTAHDEQIKKAHGMCLDCLSRYETELKITGKFKDYERKTTRSYMEDFFREAEKEKEIIKRTLEDLNYVEEDGNTEKWIFENKEEFLQKIDTDFEKLKEKILKPLQDDNKD
jgi:hypothetical protein